MKKSFALAVCLIATNLLLAGRPAARWDVVPYQKVEGVFKVGVVAFHEAGVKVVFSVNGKKVWKSAKPSLNERTGVREYVFPFDPSKYPDGPVTIGATAVAPGEKPYELPALTLYANARKSLQSQKKVWVSVKDGNDYAKGTEDKPVQTIRRAILLAGDGGTVYLTPGAYSLKQLGGGTARKYWTTVTTAPGVPRESVKVSGGRLGTDKLKFVNLDLCTEAEGDESRAIAYGEGGSTIAWFDNCDFSNRAGRSSGNSRPFANGMRACVTGGVTHDMTHGPQCELVRGHTVRDIAGEAFSGGETLVVNCRVTGIDAGGESSVDPALYRAFATDPNWIGDAILYSVRAEGCKASAILGRQLRDSAFVDVKFVPEESERAFSTEFKDRIENVVFARVDLGSQSWWWVRTATNVGTAMPMDVRLFDVKTAGFRDAESVGGVKVSEECDILWFPKGEK